ncbi:MAG: hypothetical protein JXR96_13270 [Deltaproteobacteria bacterium]|nr:hypothetical protein [Deltaproteobacteria bacterium]
MKRLWSIAAAAALLSACGPAKQKGPEGGEQAAEPAVSQPTPAPARGLALSVTHSMMGEILHLLEGVSIYRRDMPRDVFKAFEARYGLDAGDRKLLRRFAFARNELWEKDGRGEVERSFANPFGPEGLFPPAAPGLQARFWLAVVDSPEPAAVRRSLAGIVEPSDAESIAAALQQFTPRVAEILKAAPGHAGAPEKLQALLARPDVVGLIESLSRFCGLEPADLRIQIHPLWLPAEATAEAFSCGDHVFVGLPEGRGPGPMQLALCVRELLRCMLRRLPAGTKALASVRFVERAGWQAGSRDDFALVEGLLDAAGYGLAAPLAAAGPSEVPPWPGADARKRLAERLSPILRKHLADGRKLDGVFALEAARAQVAANPPRPAHFVDGAMVIAQDAALAPFKAKVTRWIVWKFPPTQRYNYPRKLDEAPGRSVLMVLTPRDLKELPGRFPNLPKIQKAMAEAYEALKRKRGVIVCLPRASRGYVFVMAAKGPKAMQAVADAFFKLEAVPGRPVEVD